jgi:hypothetical protein
VPFISGNKNNLRPLNSIVWLTSSMPRNHQAEEATKEYGITNLKVSRTLTEVACICTARRLQHIWNGKCLHTNYILMWHLVWNASEDSVEDFLGRGRKFTIQTYQKRIWGVVLKIPRVWQVPVAVLAIYARYFLQLNRSKYIKLDLPKEDHVWGIRIQSILRIFAQILNSVLYV